MSVLGTPYSYNMQCINQFPMNVISNSNRKKWWIPRCIYLEFVHKLIFPILVIITREIYLFYFIFPFYYKSIFKEFFKFNKVSFWTHKFRFISLIQQLNTYLKLFIIKTSACADPNLLMRFPISMHPDS